MNLWINSAVQFRHLAIAWCLFGSAAGSARADGPVIKIMPLGDSITQGGKGTGISKTEATVGYRYPLYFLLKNAGYNVDFVGTQNTIDNAANNTPSATNYPLYQTAAFDRDHQGFWGTTAANVNGNTHASSIEKALNTLKAQGNVPDVVLIHLGTNDLPGITTPAGVDGVIARMSGIVSDLRAANPNVKVFLSTIDANVTTAGYETARLDYNAKLGTLATTLTTRQSPVYWFDLVGKGFNADSMTYDAIHMNKAGEDLTAREFYRTLVETGSVPEPGSALLLLGGSALMLRRFRRSI